MTWSQPLGFRLPGHVSLPIMSRALERHAWPTWRAEAIRALAVVTEELAKADAAGTSRDELLRSLSHSQVGEEDLVICRAQRAGLLLRAAEFLDVAHAEMHRPSALPLPPRLDLRCTAQFMDDPSDAESTWIYVLLGTELGSMEAMFAAFPWAESYPLPLPDEVSDKDEQAQERATIWQRVIGRYVGFSPPSIIAPEMNLTFDLVESIASGADEDLSGRGKITVTEVLDEILRMRGGGSHDELRRQVVAPIV